ncbi:hypothetical protein CLV46_0681 [Diaminobutyricimonas aerilata]|uniref:Cysteine-rich secretory protein family protein n=2 Tax=Diaminobutyricimonas aerilata TaxID=1162967 RepID=A0A2M9CGY1_9MICO|nr:hypothetical protein CLV46_0681 [Diaminobutyricimonas aerilata]
MLSTVFTTVLAISLAASGHEPAVSTVAAQPVEQAAAPAERSVVTAASINRAGEARLEAQRDALRESLGNVREHLAQAPADEPAPTTTAGDAVAAERPSGTNAAATVSATGASAPTAAPQPAAPSCPAPLPGGTGSAPARVSAGGVAGTTSADLAAFASAYNGIRVANCLPPVPTGNFRYDACMEDRLFWMAEDPSTDPMSAWGHLGSVRSDGVPSVGCDGNLAGGTGNTGSTVAQKWWDSMSHRASLYRPGETGGTAGVCVYFAMSHGGVPNEPVSFTRAAARWGAC